MLKIRILALLLFFCTTTAWADTETREIMREVEAALSYLLPISVNDERFLSEDNRTDILEQLSALERSAASLAEHGGSQSIEFGILANSFARAVRGARQNYDYLQPSDARYLLTDLSQHCVACHSRDPSQRKFLLSEGLLQYLEQETLSAREQAYLQVALRQFKDAAATWVSILLDPANDPIDMALQGDFGEYLRVAIRVNRDYSGANALLTQVLDREDVPFYLRRRIEKWRLDLEAFSKEGSDNLERAKQIFHQSSQGASLAWDSDNLVNDMTVSSILREQLADQQSVLSPDQQSEIYYLLGVIEGRTHGYYYNVPVMEGLWEAAIRVAPKSPWAVDAYALIEEYTLSAYSGELPFEQAGESLHHLTELRELMGLE